MHARARAWRWITGPRAAPALACRITGSSKLDSLIRLGFCSSPLLVLALVLELELGRGPARQLPWRHHRLRL